MNLVNNLENEKAIGKEMTAWIGENKAWVTYTDGNDGEKNYYKDVFSKENGCLIYSYGETCRIESYDEITETVTLSNESIDSNDFPNVFTIPYKQYIEDFTMAVNIN